MERNAIIFLRQAHGQVVMCTDYVQEKRELLVVVLKDRKLNNIPKITQSVLIIWGEEDKIFPLELDYRLKRKVKLQQKTNTIACLQSSQGIKLDTFDDILNEFVQFFTDSLGVVDGNVERFSDCLLKQILGVELTSVLQDSLNAPVSHKEIKDVLFSMNGNKAPGPDGFSARFFQAAWNIVGPDFLRAVQFFFATSSLPDSLNSTIITLVPKVEVVLALSYSV
ncbi:hypothetical protein GQ457_10G005050 [Hibiscus cannabinus]